MTNKFYLVTIAEVCALLVVIGLTIFSLRTANKANKISREIAGHSRRPWIKVTPHIVDPLSWDKGDGRMAIQFVLKNVGNAPATNIEVTQSVLIKESSYDAILDEQKLMSDRVKELKILGRIALVFPDDEESESWGITISAKSIEDHAARAKEQGIKDPVPPIYIIGFVRYRSSIGNTEHQTGFVYRLRKIKPVGKYTVWITHKESVPIDNLLLEATALGPGAIY